MKTGYSVSIPASLLRDWNNTEEAHYDRLCVERGRALMGKKRDPWGQNPQRAMRAEAKRRTKAYQQRKQREKR
jgi:hypothetical protein